MIVALSTALSTRAGSARSFTGVLGLIFGLLLPTVAALLYLTYHVVVQPAWLEITRQLGTPFIVGEVVVIIQARSRGFKPSAVICRLRRSHRAALGIFAATFWISSVLVSQNPSFSIALTLNWVVHALFAAAVYSRAVQANRIDAADMALGFVAGLAVLAMMTAIHFTFHPAGLTFHGPFEGWGSAIPGFISQRLFGAWAGAVLALLLGIAWRQPSGTGPSRGGPAWLYPAIALAAGLMVWSGTRAAVLGTGVALVAAWLVNRRGKRSGFWLDVMTGITVGALVGLLLPPYGDPAFQLVHSVTENTPNGVTSGRITFWISALKVAVQYPMFGAGAGSCWWLVPLNGFFHVQPHNAIVEFLLIWGIVPTVALLMLLGSATWQAHRAARRLPELLPFIMMLDCLLTVSMLDGMLHFSRFIILIFALLALCLAGNTRAEEAEAASPS